MINQKIYIITVAFSITLGLLGTQAMEVHDVRTSSQNGAEEIYEQVVTVVAQPEEIPKLSVAGVPDCVLADYYERVDYLLWSPCELTLALGSPGIYPRLLVIDAQTDSTVKVAADPSYNTPPSLSKGANGNSPALLVTGSVITFKQHVGKRLAKTEKYISQMIVEYKSFYVIDEIMRC